MIINYLAYDSGLDVGIEYISKDSSFNWPLYTLETTEGRLSLG